MGTGTKVGLAAVAGLGAAVVGGVVVDQLSGGAGRRNDHRREVQRLGSLRGDVVKVRTDDGLLLHAEVDEIAPYGSMLSHDDEPTIVFVHGFALNLDCWHFQRLAFRGKRRMVFYDQRSHGRSGRSEPEHATIDQLGRDLRTVIEALAPGRRVVLVGHSMGGMSIVALAEQHPELFADRVVGVALVSTTAGGAKSHKMVAKYVPEALGRRAVERGLVIASSRDRLLELARRGSAPISQRVIAEFAFGEKVPPTYAAFLDSMIAATPLKVLVQFIPAIDALDKFHVVGALSAVPTWILCGTRDKLTSIGHSRKLHAHIPGSHLVEFHGGGHMPIFEFHERVNETLGLLFSEADELALRLNDGDPHLPPATQAGPA